MIQRHKRHPELFETHKRPLLDALRACRSALIESRRHQKPSSPTYRRGSQLITAIDDMASELTGDREMFWAKGSSG